MKTKFTHFFFVLQGIVLLCMLILELNSLSSSTPPYHHLILPVIPGVFLILGLIHLYITVDLPNLLAKSYPLCIAGVFSLLFLVAEPIPAWMIAMIELMGIGLLVAGYRAFLTAIIHPKSKSPKNPFLNH